MFFPLENGEKNPFQRVAHRRGAKRPQDQKVKKHKRPMQETSKKPSKKLNEYFSPCPRGHSAGQARQMALPSESSTYNISGQAKKGDCQSSQKGLTTVVGNRWDPQRDFVEGPEFALCSILRCHKSPGLREREVAGRNLNPNLLPRNLKVNVQTVPSQPNNLLICWTSERSFPNS